MARWISMIVLLGVIGFTAVVMFRVMSSFLLPLFLAAVLTVIFRPIHEWMYVKCKQRPALASLLTTLVVLLAVLAPIGTVVVLAVREGLGAVSGDVLDRAQDRVESLRRAAHLDVPFELGTDESNSSLTLRDLDNQLRALPDPDQWPETGADVDQVTRERLVFLLQGLTKLHQRLRDIELLARGDQKEEDDTHEMKCVRNLVSLHPESPFGALEEVIATLREVSEAWNVPIPADLPVVIPREIDEVEEADRVAESEAGVAGIKAAEDVEVTDEAEAVVAIREVDELRRRYSRLKPKYEAFRIDLLQGPVQAWVIDMVNPDTDALSSLRSNLQRYLRSWLPSVAGQATALAGHIVLGLGIMTLALYYFLKDGPTMLQTVMRLSPLEDRYERELLREFDSMSRAVVLATLLSALAQAILAGIAYYFAGFESLFLLTSLTFLLAMVPFVGAAAVWVPACLWLAFVDERFWAAIVLLGYGGGVISMVDNVVKPYVLHGQSKLHPLLALLSVLGGVQVLGPIGILVGPMIVSFLQALLNILHTELASMDAR